MNPCPCGYFPDRQRCHCSEPEIARYLSKISGPILDRIDMTVEVSRPPVDTIEKIGAESSKDMREKVVKAREIQKMRYIGKPYTMNSELYGEDLNHFCRLGKSEKDLMPKAFSSLGLSIRAYHKIIKLARTIADIEESEVINVSHLEEAISYRTVNRKYWN